MSVQADTKDVNKEKEQIGRGMSADEFFSMVNERGESEREEKK